MADNLTLPPKEVICALINAQNVATGAAFTPELLEFGIPSQSTQSRNTDLTVTAVEGSGYVGDVVLNYDRLHLQTQIADAYVASSAERNLVFPVGNAANISDMIPEINARLNINLTPDDYTDGVLPSFTGVPNEELDVQVVVKADSLCYRGSMTFKLKSEDIELSTVIVNKTLSGLTYQAPA